MNNLHPTIKFTFEHSTQKISFLDTKIHTDVHHKLSTTLYRKPTDCVALLHFHSNHPLKCKESIIFSKAFRYSLLIADENILQKELGSLTTSFLVRNTPWKTYSQHL